MPRQFTRPARAARRYGKTSATFTLFCASAMAAVHASPATPVHGGAKQRKDPVSYCAYEVGSDLVAEAVNNRNQVAGTAILGDLAQAFVWDSSRGVRLLGVLPEGVISIGSDINDRGEVIGASGPTGFVWDERSGMRPLATLGGQSSTATHINNLGQIVGLATTTVPEEGEHLFFRDVDGEVEDLGPGRIPFGVNDLSQVGFSVQSQTSFDSDVFIWRPRKGVRRLRGFPEGLFIPNAFNDRGHIVGAENVAGFAHAFRWTRGKGAELLPELSGATFSVAFDVNTRGTVIGAHSTGAVRPFIWRPKAGTRDLTTMIDATSPSNFNQQDMIISARAVNDLEWIVVNTAFDPQQIAGRRVYVLTPKFRNDGSACRSSPPPAARPLL